MEIVECRLERATQEGERGEVLVRCPMTQGDEVRRQAEGCGQMRYRAGVQACLQRIDHAVHEADYGKCVR